MAFSALGIEPRPGGVFLPLAGDLRRLGFVDPNAATSPVRNALREGSYPWYDPGTDRARPVWPVRLSWINRLTKRLDALRDWIRGLLGKLRFGGGSGLSAPGDWIGTLLLAAALVAFFASLIVLWLRHETGAAGGEAAGSRLGSALRLGELPEGVRPGDGDPWAEAQSRRAAGDLAGSIVCLFAHQLVTLDQLGLIHLAPGRTGRHYLQLLHERELAEAFGATLRLFEDVYYGRRVPTARAFESVWNRALEFEERRRRPATGAPR
jgi:hypothetical protein